MGRKEMDLENKKQCYFCKGTGKVKECSCKPIGRYEMWECVRRFCDGTETEKVCDSCNGTGYKE